MKKLMHFLAKLFPANSAGENAFAVNMFHRMTRVKESFYKLKNSHEALWPPYPGSYKVVNTKGNIAVCTLTSENFFSKDLSIFRVAITGTVMTPNLGIERIILNIISNANIRHLLICGKESPGFKVGQAFESLFLYGTDKNKRIINAEGRFPVLGNLSEEQIHRFLKQVEFINLVDEREEDNILNAIQNVKIKNEPFQDLIFSNAIRQRKKHSQFLNPEGKECLWIMIKKASLLSQLISAKE